MWVEVEGTGGGRDEEEEELAAAAAAFFRFLLRCFDFVEGSVAGLDPFEVAWIGQTVVVD